MKIANVFGRLLLNVSERLKRLAEWLGTTDIGQENTTEITPSKTLIWDVLDGPFHRDNFDDEELEVAGVDDNYNCFIVVRLQEGDSVGTVNFWVETVEEAYDIMEHFKHNIEPLEII